MGKVEKVGLGLGKESEREGRRQEREHGEW